LPVLRTFVLYRSRNRGGFDLQQRLAVPVIFFMTSHDDDSTRDRIEEIAIR
jgi:hypothetical protein